ncbi:MAG: hypothetical protein GY870_07820 [archaeon]|nr:hypothetical protein [archaeon]
MSFDHLMEKSQIENFSIELFNTITTHVNLNHEILIVSHENSDNDAVGSAFGMYFLIKNNFVFNPKLIKIFLPTINLSAKKIVESMKLQSYFHQNEETIESNNKKNILLIVLDTNNIDKSLNQKFLDDINKIIIIDHHEIPSNFKEKVKLKFIIPELSSCCEIITGIWREWDQIPHNTIKERKNLEFNNEIKKKISNFLLIGILSDSARLKYSTNWIFAILAFLSENGADLKEIRQLMNQKWSNDERIARLKGAIRCIEPIIIKNWIVVFTNINAFESSVCRSLINLGADIAFCISNQKKGNFRLIVRSSENFQLNTTFNFGKFMENFGLKYSGHGGGHKGAAGMNGKNAPDNIKEIVISELRKDLNNG